ncbi:MAG: response regulator [Burkholderiaceae bacterium]
MPATSLLDTRIRSLHDDSDDGLIVVEWIADDVGAGGDLRVVYANRSASRIVGIEDDPGLADVLPAGLSRAHALAGDTSLVDALYAKSAWTGLIACVEPDGEREYRVRVRPMASGSAILFDEMSAIDAIIDASGACRRRMDALFVYLAHEFRTPLAGVRNALAILASHAPGDLDAVIQARSIGDRQARHMIDLLDDLRDVANDPGSGQTSGRGAFVRPADLFGASIRELGPTLARAGVDVSQGPFQGTLLVEGERLQLLEMLRHAWRLLARELPSGSTIALSSRARVSVAELRVTMSGPGLVPSLCKRLRRVFGAVEDDIDLAIDGASLSGFLMRRVLREHQGSLRWQTSDSDETELTLVISLPACEEAELVGREDIATPPRTKARYGRRRILVVDDDGDARESLMTLLTMNGHQVTGAATGGEALESFASDRPDAVLMDIALPDGSGWDFADRMRALPATENVAILALSGFSRPVDVTSSMAASMDRHLVKPIAIETLLAEVDDACRRRRARD